MSAPREARSTRLTFVLQPPLDTLFPRTLSDFTTRAHHLMGAIHELCLTSAGAASRILRGDEALNPGVHVFLNGSRVPPPALVQQAIANGDEVCLLTALCGG